MFRIKNKIFSKLVTFMLLVSTAFLGVRVPKTHAVDFLVDISRGSIGVLSEEIWKVFENVLMAKGEEAIEDLMKEHGGEDIMDPDLFLESMRDSLDPAIDSLDLEDEIIVAFLQGDSPDEIFGPGGPGANVLDPEAEMQRLIEINTMLDGIIGNLNDNHFFDYNLMGYTEEELRRVLFSIYLKDIIMPVDDVIAGQIGADTDVLNVAVSPEFPRPGEIVNITLNSPTFNTQTAHVTWIHRSETILSGVGQTHLRGFRLGMEGTPEVFKVIIRKETGGIIERDIRVRPANVDILYEVDTYVPPFYKGKPEYSHESVIKFVALPTVMDANGRVKNINEFSYKWYVNGKVIRPDSAAGRNFFYYEDDFAFGRLKVDVRINGIRDDFQTIQTIVVDPNDPKILLYEDHPSYGTIFERALVGIVQTSNREIGVRAAPYFFSDKNLLNYRWFVNNQNLPAVTGSTVTLRTDSGTPTLADLSVRIANPIRVAQSAHNFFRVLVNQ